MASLLWKLPYPSSGGVETQYHNDILYIEDTSGENISYRIVFSRVDSFSITSYHDLQVEQIELSYDRLMEKSHLGPLKCFEICFDDGPCYEIVASSFVVEEWHPEKESK